ncbi:MAG: hypothetical protein PF501_08690 [Salinisphaera sp.]|jgi:hypothetical protein|nr:hypothetical protein [Salinisphaera sp.]
MKTLKTVVATLVVSAPVAGAAHFSKLCTGCDIPPGGQVPEAAEGMAPQPSDLVESGPEMLPQQIFWVLQHGHGRRDGHSDEHAMDSYRYDTAMQAEEGHA